MIWSTLLSALLPVVTQGASQLITKATGGVKPTTVAEQIELDKQDIARLEALAKLDNPVGTPSQWVIDLRASARYVAAGIVIVGGFGVVFLTGAEAQVKALALEAANIAFGFLFGSRLAANLYKK